jgi:hypothetical protein
VPYREVRPAKDPTRIVRARIVLAISASLVLGWSGWRLPSLLAERVFACDRAQSRCTLDVDRSFFGNEHQEFSLSEVAGARSILHKSEDSSSWEAAVDAERGTRSLGSFGQEIECRTAVGKVASFLGGTGDSLFLRNPRSFRRLVFVFGMDALFGFLFIAGLLRRASVSFEWDANRIQVRRRRAAFWRTPVYFDLNDVRSFEIREKSDGDAGKTYSVVLVSRNSVDAELWTDTSKASQLDFAEDLNKILAENRRERVAELEAEGDSARSTNAKRTETARRRGGR